MSSGTILFILIAAAVIGYVVSIRLNPNTKCKRCKGRGFHRGAIYSYSTRACSACGGAGVRPRLGRRLFMSGKS
jgi:DnaJ-class molecular chaperone